MDGESRARAGRAAARATSGLSDAADVHLRKYSKGMLQRIGIAQALINDPELVLLDEPMTGLDPVGRLEVKRIIQKLHETGKTIIFNSHILSDVEELCSHIAIMRAGRRRLARARSPRPWPRLRRSRTSSCRWSRS